MIYKITAIFRNTEEAQSAARRINSSVSDIYEIRMNYLTRDEDIGLMNSILYSPPVISMMPNNYYWNPPESITRVYRTDNTRASGIDFGETCRLTVLTSEMSCDKVHSIIHNESGYDVNVTEIE